MNDLQLLNQTFDPLLVSIHPNGTPLNKKESNERWLALSHVSEEVYLLFASSLLTEAMIHMQQEFHLSEVVTVKIASLVRSIYFKGVSLEQLPSLLISDVGLHETETKNIIRFIQESILPLKASKKISEDSIKSTKTSISLILLKALEKYPRINDQQITGDRIVVRSEKDSVRGTVRNWLRAYRDAVGIRKHSDIERGHFLFQSENAKKLPPSERERVAVLLKALDENETLDIDTENQRIIFTVQPLTAPLPPKPLPATPALGSLPSWQHTKAPLQRFHMTTKQESSPLQQNKITAPEKTESPFRFSSGQTLSSEKREENVMATPSAPLPPIAPPSQNTNSFGLGYVGPTTNTSPSSQKIQQEREKKVWGIPETLRNVVDLRSDDDEI